jgi:hypothetical protein
VGEAGARRRAQKQISSGLCEVCDEPADRHHINEDILDNRPENIRYLCRSHHMKLHWEQRREARCAE